MADQNLAHDLLEICLKLAPTQEARWGLSGLYHNVQVRGDERATAKSLAAALHDGLQNNRWPKV